MYNRQSKKDYLFVGIQFLLFFAYLYEIPSGGIAVPAWLAFIGLVIIICGMLTGVAALLQLRKSLSPFPSPLAAGKLVTTGVFWRVRHPIYSSILFVAGGYVLYSGSFYKAFITLLLWILFYFKSEYEESLLLEKYEDYALYKRRTGRFFPRMHGRDRHPDGEKL